MRSSGVLGVVVLVLVLGCAGAPAEPQPEPQPGRGRARRPPAADPAHGGWTGPELEGVLTTLGWQPTPGEYGGCGPGDGAWRGGLRCEMAKGGLHLVVNLGPARRGNHGDFHPCPGVGCGFRRVGRTAYSVSLRDVGEAERVRDSVLAGSARLADAAEPATVEATLRQAGFATDLECLKHPSGLGMVCDARDGARTIQLTFSLVPRARGAIRRETDAGYAYAFQGSSTLSAMVVDEAGAESLVEALAR